MQLRALVAALAVLVAASGCAGVEQGAGRRVERLERAATRPGAEQRVQRRSSRRPAVRQAPARPQRKPSKARERTPDRQRPRRHDRPATTPAPPPTAPPTTAPAPAPTAPPVTEPRFSYRPYTGLGAWMDVYDWSLTFAEGVALEPTEVDRMADEGVQTLFIQASKFESPTDVLEPQRLLQFIDRAHRNGISVVAWFLPTLEDPQRDLRRLLAIAELPVDGLAVDIESTKVTDAAERSRRMVALSTALRAALPGQVLGGIVLEPVLMEDVNANYWPGYPWAGLAPNYDVWLPMAYWTNRVGQWRDAYTYTAANIDRVRAHLGQPDAPVHALGGIGDGTTAADLAGFRQAAAERGAIGASIYDHRTTTAEHWPELRPIAGLRQ